MQPETVTASRRVRVMIVDDAKFMRVKLRNILEQAGFAVVSEAEDGEQAVKVFQETVPDIVTMDITMPVMDGISALREIKKLSPDALVVVISALGQKEKVKAAVIAGACDFIIKPFLPELVVKSLSRISLRVSPA